MKRFGDTVFFSLHQFHNDKDSNLLHIAILHKSSIMLYFSLSSILFLMNIVCIISLFNVFNATKNYQNNHAYYHVAND